MHFIRRGARVATLGKVILTIASAAQITSAETSEHRIDALEELVQSQHKLMMQRV